MTRRASTSLACDLCGFSGDDETVFTARPSGVDLCRWCMSGPIGKTECGGHVVTLTNGAWVCDCGTVAGDVLRTLRAHGVSSATMAQVPYLDAATAVIHVQTPNWPRTY